MGRCEGATGTLHQQRMAPHPTSPPKLVLGTALSSTGRGDSLCVCAML